LLPDFFEADSAECAQGMAELSCSDNPRGRMVIAYFVVHHIGGFDKSAKSSVRSNHIYSDLAQL